MASPSSGVVPRARSIVAGILGVALIGYGVAGKVVHISPAHRLVVAISSPVPVLLNHKITPTAVVVKAPEANKITRKVSQRSVSTLPPLSLEIPSQAIKARITMRAEIDADGLLTAPANPRQLGWWNASAGMLVLDGHVGFDHIPGTLVNIDQLESGDQLVVQGAAHLSIRYRVVQTTLIPKGGLPSIYFSQKYNGWIMLITCGGSFNTSTGHYRSNVVTLAQPE